MKQKPVILIFNKFYLPGYQAGGPIRTIVNMVDRLGENFEFRVVTSDRDLADRNPYPDLTGETWETVGKARVHYVAHDKANIGNLAGLINDTQPALIYLNSFFDPWFTQKVLIARRLGKIRQVPIILAPRGEFSPGALAIKRLKKKVYIKAAKLAGIYKGITWQASSEIERGDIERSLGRLVITPGLVIAQNLAPPVETAVSLRTRLKRDDEPLRVCFLSRISPMKNFDFALRVLAKVNVPLDFTIYGPKEDQSYWQTCEALISALPENIHIRYAGSIHPSSVKEALGQHDLFFLPTRGENYGHVIHEALGAGLPVLLSDQTPWRDVEAQKLGWTLPLDAITPFVEVLQDCSVWDSDQWAAISKRAIEYANEKASDVMVLDRNREMLMDAISVVTVANKGES